MYVNVLDDTYTLVYVIDTFESFSWSDRYNEVGRFELTTLATITTLSYIRKGAYLQYENSEKLMIIETIEYTSDIETGDHLKASGRSLEAILDSRVIRDEMTLDGTLQEGILSLMNENIIDPEDKNRRYPIITFKKNESEELAKIEWHETYEGENLLDVITEICQACNVGFKMLPDLTNYGFTFELYLGVDRSYDQEKYPPVVFSPQYENLVNSNYVLSDETMRNVVYVNNDNDKLNLKLEVYSGLKFDFETQDETPATPPAGRARRESYVSSSVSLQDVTPYGPPSRYIERSSHGHWETSFDAAGYRAAQEAARQRARDFIEAAGGTEADIKWPPPGREGQSYEDYMASGVAKWEFTTTEYVEGPTYPVAKKTAEQLAQEKFNKAMADPQTYAKYEMRDEGFSELLENRAVKSFDGDIVNYLQYIAGRDYQLGDVVQMVNGLFVNVKTRFTELTYSFGESGLQAVPTFTTDQDMEVKEGFADGV